MIRIRCAGSIVKPEQLKKIAEISNEHAAGYIHLTTRQEIQLHYVLVHSIIPVIKDLKTVGMSSRGGGGNTVRNVVAQEEKERSFFIIQEGPRSIISSVDIYNAHSFDQATIKKRCFRKLLHNKQYDFQLYDEAIRLLASMYLNEGFLSCMVVDHSFIKTEKENEYKLIVTIDEGKKSYIESVLVEGYQELQKEGPFKNSFSLVPVPFNMKIIDEQREWLINYFQSKGHSHPRVKPQVDINDHRVSIVWIIDPGELVRFGKTIVSGCNAVLPFSEFVSLY